MGIRIKGKLCIKAFGGWFNTDRNFPEMTGRKLVAYFNFDTRQNPELVIKVALSAVSTEGAVKNLEAEAAGKTFNQLVAEANSAWNRELDVLEAKGTPDQLPCFILHCIIP